MLTKIKNNFSSHKVGYYIGIAYLLIILLSVIYDIFRYGFYGPAIWPVTLLFLFFLLTFIWPFIFGIILLLLGLVFIIALLSTGFNPLASVFLLPIVLTGYFLIAKPTAKK